MISSAGTKRALFSVTELVWTTVHHNPTNTTDLDELERIVIAESFEKYDSYIQEKKKPMRRLKKYLIKKLSR